MATPGSLAGGSMDAAITRVVGVDSFGFGVSAAGESRASAMAAGERMGKRKEMGRGC